MRARRWNIGLAKRHCVAAWVVAQCACLASAASTTDYGYVYDGDYLTANTTYVHDAVDTTLSYTKTEMDALGRQTRVISGSSADAMTTEYTYDVAGNLVTRAVKGSNDLLTVYTYDILGRQVTVKGPSTSLGAGCPETVYVYDLNGNVVTRSVRIKDTSQDPYAHTVTEYDALDRPIVVTDPGRYVRKTFYNSRSLPIRELVCQTDGLTVLEQRRTEYDAAGRVIRRIVMAAPSAGVDADPDVQSDRVTVYDYDDDGHLTLQRIYNMRSSTPLDTTKEYDGLGRLTKTTDPKGFYEVLEYNGIGLVTRRTQTEGGTTYSYSLSYDSAGRLVTSIASGPPELTTTYAYDDLGRRTKVTDPAGQVTLFVYDSLGRQVTKIEDDGGATARTTRYQYSERGLLTAVIANDGTSDQTTNYSYDSNGRVAAIAYPDSTGDTDRLRFTYYPNGKVYERIDQAENTLRYYYDKRGLLVTKGDFVNGELGVNFLVTYVYDGLGRMVTAKRGTSSNDDAQGVIVRRYNGLSQVIEESQAIDSDGQGAKTIRMEYDQVGNRLRLVYPE